MHEPAFWREKDLRSRKSAPVLRLLLTPVSAIYQWAGARRIRTTEPFDAGIPVICVGNLTVGGSGKTPLTTYLREQLVERGVRAATLSRGYGGTLKGPLKVDPTTVIASEVGDEPLMMACSGESWIGRDRVAAVKAMKANGVDIVLMDDGHQNPSLKKTLSLVVIDAGDPIGNGFVFPKGPLREPVEAGLERADAVIVMGQEELPTQLLSGFNRPVIKMHITPRGAPQDGNYVAFAGIGRPLKFFDTLASYKGVTLEEAVPYPDHHPYSDSDITFLRQLADERDARLITTEKDLMRLTPAQREGIMCLPVTVTGVTENDKSQLDELIAKALGLEV